MQDLRSPTRDRTCAVKARSPNHWTAREVPVILQSSLLFNPIFLFTHSSLLWAVIWGQGDWFEERRKVPIEIPNCPKGREGERALNQEKIRRRWSQALPQRLPRCGCLGPPGAGAGPLKGRASKICWLFFFKIIYLFYFWLCWVFVAARAFSSCGEQGLLSSCGAQASHCSELSCCRARAPGRMAFSSCSSQALERRTW